MKIWSTLARKCQYKGDSAKKEYPVNNTRELALLKAKYERRDANGKKIMPAFFAPVSRKKGYYNPARKSYVSHATTMDYLQRAMREFRKGYVKQEISPFSVVIEPVCDSGACNYRQVSRVISIVCDTREEIAAVWADDNNYDKSQKHLITHEIQQRCADYIGSMQFNAATMYALLMAIEDPKNKHISRLLFSILFSVPNLSFYQILDASRQPLDVLVEDKNGTINIYDFWFSKSKNEGGEECAP